MAHRESRDECGPRDTGFHGSFSIGTSEKLGRARNAPVRKAPSSFPPSSVIASISYLVGLYRIESCDGRMTEASFSSDVLADRQELGHEDTNFGQMAN